MSDPHEANRNTIVSDIHIFDDGIISNSKGFKELAASQGIRTDKFWIVFVEVKVGSLPKSHFSYTFATEEEAKAFVTEHPTGSVFPSMQDTVADGEISRTMGSVVFDEPKYGRIYLSSGDQDCFLVLDTIRDAGLADGWHLSSKVRSFLGEARLKELIDMYDKNWEVVACMEFCWYNLPSSSNAYIACQQAYNHYVAENEFAAGYLLRDLEILASGTEAAAVRANDFSEKQAKRSAKGGAAQAEKAAMRRKLFFSIALESASRWVWKSEREQLRFLRTAAAEKDQQTGDCMFQQGGKLLSDSWFEDAISDLRQSGELERVLSPRKP